MTVISWGPRGPVGPIGPAAPQPASPRPSAAFDVPGAATPPAIATSPVAPPSLLAVQEAGHQAVRDREARRHANALLAALGALQRALLGDPEPGTLDRLAALLQSAPPPDDPRLAELQRALLQRAAVELARNRIEASG